MTFGTVRKCIIFEERFTKILKTSYLKSGIVIKKLHIIIIEHIFYAYNKNDVS